MKRRRAAVLVGTLLVLAACAKVAGIDSLEIGECKGGPCPPDATRDAPVMPEKDTSPPIGDDGGFDASKPCPGDGGAAMVRIGTATNNFCIDSTEVTVQQYREFTVAKGADMTGQPPVCEWNITYAALFEGADDTPIAGVDWCDARAYCAWSGKRLCGKRAMGAFAGPVGVPDLAAVSSHEWLAACTRLGQVRYPYGPAQKPEACNTAENEAGAPVAVKSKATCQGGFDGVYDLVGNVWEWFDGPCLTPDAGADAGGTDASPQKDDCFVKGGGFPNAGAGIDCYVDGRGASRERRAAEIGLRCCSD